MEGRRLALATRAQPVEVKQVWIGSLAVDASCTEPAVDSSPALRHGDWPVLAQRLHEHGYLAFSRFWAEERLEPALRHVQALGQLRDLAGAGFEVNTATLAANGAEDPLQRLREDVQLQDVLRAVLLEAGDVVVPEQFTFQLSWVRGKRACSTAAAAVLRSPHALSGVPKAKAKARGRTCTWITTTWTPSMQARTCLRWCCCLLACSGPTDAR